MQSAVDQTGAPVRAEAGAPAWALCQRCGGAVSLRRRHHSYRPGAVTYFWRHEDNANLDCPTRPSAASRIGPIERP